MHISEVRKTTLYRIEMDATEFKNLALLLAQQRGRENPPGIDPQVIEGLHRQFQGYLGW